MSLNFLDLFSGIGGFSLGAEWAGLHFSGHYYSDIEPYANKVYQLRFPDAIPLGDICKINGKDLPDGEWIIAGGFPCQDISVAGKGAGLEGARSGLWYEYARIIGELRPRFAIMENVGALTHRGLDRVLGSLAEIGYDAEWQDIRASDVGAPHRRERIWIVAYPNGERREARGDNERKHEYNIPQERKASQDIEQRNIGISGTGEVHADNVAYPDSEHGQRRPESQLSASAGGQSRDKPARGGITGDMADANETRPQGQCESGGATTKQPWPWGVVSDVPNSDKGRLSISQYEPIQERATGAGERSRSPRNSWWTIEPDVGRGLDGLSAWLDGLDLTVLHEYNATHGTTTKERPGEVLRELRRSLRAIENEREAGGQKSISSEKVLLAYLCKLETHLDKETDLFVESQETPQGSLRGLRYKEKSASPSRGPEPEKQHAREYRDSLQALSRLLAHDAEKAWIAYRRENASVVRHWESGIARVAHGIPARVDRLKCLGNSIVPQIAALIFSEIKKQGLTI